MQKTNVIITIDGPSGVGKGTVAREVADKLGFSCLDTGAMYRAVALKASLSKTEIENESAIKKMLDGTVIDFSGEKVLLDSEDVSSRIRTEQISAMSSKLAALPQVRKFLVKIQRKIGSRGNLVAEGRDMGTYVFPHAEFKFYLDATVEKRAERRFKQLGESGYEVDFASLKKDLLNRDKQDMERKESPLHPALNAVIIDTTDLGKSEVVSKILLHIGGSIGNLQK